MLKIAFFGCVVAYPDKASTSLRPGMSRGYNLAVTTLIQLGTFSYTAAGWNGSNTSGFGQTEMA